MVKLVDFSMLRPIPGLPQSIRYRRHRADLGNEQAPLACLIDGKVRIFGCRDKFMSLAVELPAKCFYFTLVQAAANAVEINTHK